jgi:hypothetical protein
MKIAQVECHAGKNSPNWRLYTGSGLRKSVYFVPYGTIFRKRPKVSVSIKAFDIIQGTNHRLNINVERVFRNGVEIAFTTWSGTKVYSAGITAIAVGEKRNPGDLDDDEQLPIDLAPMLEQENISDYMLSSSDSD